MDISVDTPQVLEGADYSTALSTWPELLPNIHSPQAHVDELGSRDVAQMLEVPVTQRGFP